MKTLISGQSTQTPQLSALGCASVVLIVALLAAGGCEEAGVTSYRVDKDERLAPISWTLPEGWARLDESKPMRFATITTGDGLEVAVTRLPGQAGGVAQNIARWRRQVGLEAETDASSAPPDGQDQMMFEAGAGRAVMVNLAGPGIATNDPNAPPDPMRLLAAIYPSRTYTWFVKMMGPADRLAPHLDDFAQFALSVRLPHERLPDWFASPPTAPPDPPAARADPPAHDGPAPLRWSLPSGWKRMERNRPMSVASFEAGDGPSAPVVTLTPLPGSAGGVLPNVNRWRRQLGLAPLERLEGVATAVEIGGSAGHRVDLVSGDGPARRILAVILPSRPPGQPMSWFFKLDGQGDRVAGQVEAFDQFVKSIEFHDVNHDVNHGAKND